MFKEFVLRLDTHDHAKSSTSLGFEKIRVVDRFLAKVSNHVSDDKESPTASIYHYEYFCFGLNDDGVWIPFVMSDSEFDNEIIYYSLEI